MIWGGISYQAKTELVFIPCGVHGGLTSERYVEEVVTDHVLPFVPLIGENFVLMHDNARPHTGRCVREFLEEVNIPTLDWPAVSPDMNPIEHLWDQFKRRVRARVPAPQTVAELKMALEEEWEAIPQTSVQTLIRSMRNRLEAVIRARGGNTKY
ncbi:hypothetical protein M8J75_002280 [Diaphorina citri]|nr:hypothetical protein M8J75_002280 [Diaphorina citri]